jgi:hypothetical protein
MASKLIGPYRCQGDKDQCAGVGHAVLVQLRMRDDDDVAPRDVANIIKDMQQSLRIISTWAACDAGSGQTRQNAMQDIRNMALQGLSKEST